MIDALGPEDYRMVCGRMISSSKLGMEGQDCVWNANLYTKEQGKIWYGDINLTKESEHISALAKERGETVYLFREHDCRFKNEENPDLELAIKVFSHKD